MQDNHYARRHSDQTSVFNSVGTNIMELTDVKTDLPGACSSAMTSIPLQNYGSLPFLKKRNRLRKRGLPISQANYWFTQKCLTTWQQKREYHHCDNKLAHNRAFPRRQQLPHHRAASGNDLNVAIESALSTSVWCYGSIVPSFRGTTTGLTTYDVRGEGR